MAAAGIATGAGEFNPTAPVKVATNTSGGPYVKAPGQVKLAAGQSLHYTPGKGYYAAAAAPAPAASTAASTDTTETPQSLFTPQQLASVTPLTNPQITQQATQTANEELQGQEAPLLQAQQTTDATNAATEKQASAFDLAGNNILKTLGPTAQAGFNQGAQEQTQLGNAFTGTVGSDLAQQQATNAAIAATVGATGGNAPQTVDQGAFGNALDMGGSFIPSSNLAAQGAEANQAGAGEQGVNVDTSRLEQQGLAATATSDDLKSAQDIANLAAKYPSWFTTEEHALISQNAKDVSDQIDMAKANTSAQTAAAEVTNYNSEATYRAAQAGNLTNEEATRTYDAQLAALKDQADITQGSEKIQLTQNKNIMTAQYDNAQLKIRTTTANTASVRAATEANAIDASGSKVAGFVRLKDGQWLLGKNGMRIPVVQTGSSSVAAQFSKAVKATATLVGSPETISESDKTAAKGANIVIGNYLLAPGLNPIAGETAASKEIPATTNDPARAQKNTTLTFAQAQAQMAGEYPSLSKAQIRSALIRGGIKPAGTQTSYATVLSNTKEAFNQGITLQDVTARAIAAGWPRALITKALKATYGAPSAPLTSHVGSSGGIQAVG